MFLQKKEYLRDIQRLRIPEHRDLKDGLRLDRNEKVDNWPEDFIAKVLEKKMPSFFSTYPDLNGLYQKIADHLGVSKEQVLVSSGIDGCIKILFEILVDPNDLVGVFAPTYAMYDVYSKLFRAKMYHIGYNEDFEPNWKSFEDFFTQHPQILFLPNPNQPIESCFSLDELRNIAKKCLEAGCLLVVDEAYHYFGAESSIPLIQEFENVVVMRTFSKAFGIPSARIGYMVSTVDNMELLSKTRIAHETNSISASIAEYLLDNIEIVKNYTASINASREYVLSALKILGISARGSYGSYLLLSFSSDLEAQKIVQHLKSKKIYVKGPWSQPWDNCITITLGKKDLMEKFIRVISEYLKEKKCVS